MKYGADNRLNGHELTNLDILFLLSQILIPIRQHILCQLQNTNIYQLDG